MNEAVRKVLSETLPSLKDPRIGFVTVTGVRTTKDLSQATVYVSVLGSAEEQTRTLEGLRIVYATFGIGFGVAGAIFGLLYRHALVQADSIGLSAAERIRTRRSVERYVILVGVALLSLALAFLLPVEWASSGWYTAAPGLVYALIIPLGRWAAWRERRALDALGAS